MPRLALVEVAQRGAGGVADVLRLAVVPGEKAGRDVVHVERPVASKALGECERHLGVVRDLTRRQIEPAAAYEISQSSRMARSDLLSRLELHRPAQRVPAGESEQSPSIPIDHELPRSTAF